MPSRWLARRITRLETGPGGTRGPCRACGGVGRITLVDEAAGETAETARGCSGCGRVSKRIILTAAGEGAAHG